MIAWGASFEQDVGEFQWQSYPQLPPMPGNC